MVIACTYKCVIPGGRGLIRVQSTQRHLMTYEPSPFEQLWFTNGSAQGRICLITSWQVEGALRWLDFAARSRGRLPHRAPSSEEQGVLSRFAVQSEGAAQAEYEYIEPLTGIARHPFTPIWGCARKARAGGSNASLRAAIARMQPPSGVLDTSYLIPASRCGRQQPERRGRAMLFDLGASMPGDDWDVAAARKRSGGHPPTGSKAYTAWQASKAAAIKAEAKAKAKAEARARSSPSQPGGRPSGKAIEEVSVGLSRDAAVHKQVAPQHMLIAC